ncbi:MAG: Gfo/Idh/MocA family oxidoreductase [Arcanobacterium sp.]|nr:Gfo/Idh/MocA family oxidoreductase [Arcanobacterium sp.]MDY5589249.1 Gfo/Idh/MocA family oxidoreductase [Arcanobacterium sp.]
MAIKIALVGAGWWAHSVHGPMDKHFSGTDLVGIWARSPEKGQAFADELGVPYFSDFHALLNECDAVDFAVPPNVQAAMALEAARRGKALILEKPLALDLANARALAETVDALSLPTVACFTRRFSPEADAFVATAHQWELANALLGIQATYLSNGLLPQGALPPSGTWRHELYGSMQDLTPHVMNLAIHALGPVVHVQGVAGRFSAYTAVHASGAVTTVNLSSLTATDGGDIFRESLCSTQGIATFDDAAVDHTAAWQRIHSEFVSAVENGTKPTADIFDELAVQEVIEAVIRSHKSRQAIHIADL